MSARAFLRALTRDGQLKLAAFGLACFLWVLVRVGNPGQRDLLIPVEIGGLEDSGWTVLADPVPDTVRVYFRGPQAEIFGITGFDLISVIVPITEMSGEEMEIQLQPEWVSLAGYRGVQVENIVPGAITVRLDRLSTRTIPVRASTRGSLPEGLALANALTLTPDRVRVSGPASFVDAIDTLDVVVLLSGVRRAVTVETVVDTVGIGRVSVIPFAITVDIPAEESVERVFTGVRVITYPVAGAGPIQVFPENMRVTVRGASSRVSAMDPDILQAVVPSNALLDLGASEERRVPIRVEGVPSYVSVVPSSDTVSVRRRLGL